MKQILMLLTNAFLPDPRPYQEARSLIKAGYKVKILCWDRGEGLLKKETVNGIDIERIRLRSGHGIGSRQVFCLIVLWVRFVWFGIKEDAKIVYCHDLDTLLPGIVLKKIKNAKLVFDSHEIYSKMLGSNINPIIKKIASFLERICIRHADAVIVTCPAMQDFYKKEARAGSIIAGSWKNIPDFEFSDDILKKEKQAFNIKDELVVCYIANLGPERIIRPLLEIAQKDKGIFVLIGGDGPQSSIVKEFAGRNQNIVYLGYVPHSKVNMYTALSDIVYYGYDKRSGMAEFNAPNKLFEALAAGKAFIGGNFGEMGRILEEEYCGIALDEFKESSVQAGLDILKNTEKLRLYQQNAKRAAVKKYNWPNAEKNLLRAINNI
jgi:glycosyltransferase involved in cell wall biosynthesis